MFDWLPEVAREVRFNLINLYWILITPFCIFLIILEFFKIPEKNIGAGMIIKRSFISMLLLLTFDDVVNLISIISDGIVEKIEGPTKLMNLMETLKYKYTQYEGGIFDLKESIIFFLNLLAYLIAYLGIFVSNALIHFVMGILYCVSPLMILMYCSEKTSFICGNLYKGLLSVMSWRILWSILGVFLLKLATSSEIGSWNNVFTSIVINLCIGLSMLLIPFFTKSLLSDGLVSAASGMAAAPAFLATGAAKAYAIKKMGQGVSMVSGGFKNYVGRPLWKNTGGQVINEIQNSAKFASEIGRMDKAKRVAQRGYRKLQSNITRGRRHTSDWIRKSTGLRPKYKNFNHRFIK